MAKKTKKQSEDKAEVASGAAKAVLQAGLKIPGDLSLVGLGDGELAKHGPVPLTTVEFGNLGKAGFELWMAIREGGEMKPRIVGCELVDRGFGSVRYRISDQGYGGGSWDED